MRREIVRLQKRVCRANRALCEFGLVDFTEGNVSERSGNMVAIKPSGVPYHELRPRHIPVFSFGLGDRIAGDLAPSVDLMIHLAVYRRHGQIGGIAHTHSLYATAFAQAGKPIPCLGTTHADDFFGEIPVVGFLTAAEVEKCYEERTGELIANALISPARTIAAALLRGHGAFTIGADAHGAVRQAAILEKVAALAFFTALLSQDKVETLPHYLAAFHFERKHGPRANYGQSV